MNHDELTMLRMMDTAGNNENKETGIPAFLRNKAAIAVLLVATVAGIWAAGNRWGWFVASRPPADEIAASAQTDTSDWQQSLAENTDSSYYHYIQLHRDGAFLGEALDKLDSIQESRITLMPADEE